MQRGKSIEQIIEKANEAAMTNVNGTPLVTFEEQRDWAQDIMRDNIPLKVRQSNPDGSIAKSYVWSAAVNEDRFYDNRYRIIDKVEGDTIKRVLQVVTAQTTDGYRVIQEQKSGRVAYKQIQAYNFERKGKSLVFTEAVMVSDTEFITDFTKKLNQEAMKELLPLLATEVIPEGGNMPI